MNADHSRAAILGAIARAGESLTAAPFTLAALTWHADTLAGELFCDAGEYVMKRKHRQPANVGQFTPRKTARAFRAVLPSWALAAFGACLVIPGPFDEAVAVLASLVLLVVRFPRARSAWRGGKSHRKAVAR